VALSPNGRSLAGIGLSGGREDVWIADVDRGAATRITHAGVNASPVWSGDGRSVYFAACTDDVFEIWSRRVDAADPGTRLLRGKGHTFPASASPDGTMLAFVQADPATRSDIWLASGKGGGARPLVTSPFDDGNPTFSPDSRLLAYQSAESGRWEIYVQRLESTEHEDSRILVSTDGGERPFWSRDGRALLYQSGDRLLRAAISDANGALSVGTSELVSDVGTAVVRGIAPDGRVLIERTGSSPTRAVVALEWLREVRQVLGPPAAVMPR
jgi:Tol biopolymer transport system component